MTSSTKHGLIRITSGGQTGADQGGLEAAEALGIYTMGLMPKGFKTERGPMPEVAKRFNLSEHDSPAYPPRTEMNVKICEGTVLFGNMASPGSVLTVSLCKQWKKPYICNPVEGDLLVFIEENAITTLNVAGNRESREPGIQARVKAYLIKELSS